MNPRTLTTLIRSLVPWILVLSASAEQETRVRALSLQAGGTPAELHAHDAAATATAGVVRVKTFLNHEFDVVRTKGAKLVFTTKPDPASAADAAARIGTCDLPAGAKSVILLFIPEAAGKPACRIVVVDDGVKSFPPGSFAIVNLSPLKVRIQLEGKRFEFKPGETRPIPDPPAGANQAAAMQGSALRDGTWQTFYTGAWPAPGDKRVLQIITENKTSGQPEIRGIRDVAKP